MYNFFLKAKLLLLLAEEFVIIEVKTSLGALSTF